MLKVMVERDASDLFVTAGAQPSIKVDGTLKPLTRDALTPSQARGLTYATMNDMQQSEFEAKHECNYAISAPGIGRFRVSAFFQRNSPGMVLRRIKNEIPSMDELRLPPIIKDLAMGKRGLILFVGGTSTGKSTSLASMIDYRNQNSKGHIICIEDPIEFIHDHKKCIITQREVGLDTDSFEVALKNTLRQAPDVILMGEIRSKDTMGYGLQFAETGHLCLATLHANNANQALDRIVSFFDADHHNQLWMDMSLNLKAIVAQQLLPTSDGKGRVAAIEVLLNTPLVSDLIRKGQVHELKELMKKSTNVGMQTFDQALYNLFEEGKITYEDALAHADSANDLRLMIKLSAETNPELQSRIKGGEDGDMFFLQEEDDYLNF
nr:PilT/PilU family type 4a pilus ATPase [Motiliproteus sp. SC1-56]